jgi:1-acyl-sn-glycerol-3-phosphate acyltransferase
MSHLRALRVGLTLLCWTLLLIGPQYLARTLPGLRARRAGDKVGRLFLRGVAHLIGIRVVRRGAPAPARPLLYVANHMSWLDIVVLGGLDDTRFVARHDMADWPLFGLFAKLHRSVFVERRASQTVRGRDDLLLSLRSGDAVTLFPEGQAGDGNRVMRFRSSFLAAAEVLDGEAPLTVQAVTIAFTHLGPMPLGYDRRHFYAWVGDTPLGGHLWRVLGLGPATCMVEYHAPTALMPGESRKALTDRLHATVSGGLARANAGRLDTAAFADAERPEPETGRGAAAGRVRGVSSMSSGRR